jgi:hypothetical protein
MAASFSSIRTRGSMSDDVRMHRQNEEVAFLACVVELAGPDLEDIVGLDVKKDRKFHVPSVPAALDI